MAIRVKLNGEEEQLSQEMTIPALLEQKHVREEYVTVEINENIIAKEEYSTTVIREGDEVEFIYYMGGGRKWGVGSR